MAYLIIAQDGKKKKMEIKGDYIFVGRGADNQLTFDDPEISIKHCQILRTQDGFRIIDLGSESGTFVNGHKVTEADLTEKDVIKVGNIKMAVKDIAPAEEAVETPMLQPGRKSTARRRKSQRVVGQGAQKQRGRKEPEPLTIKKEFADASSGGGDRLVRKNLRKGSKIPGWAQICIGIVAFWILIGFGYLMIKGGASSKWRAQFLIAKNYEAQNEPHLAKLAYAEIPVEDPEWGVRAQAEIKRLQDEEEAGKEVDKVARGKTYFTFNIMLFIEKYIDAPEDKPKQAAKIRREYSLDRECYIRALIKRRINHYIDTFPNGEFIDQVKSLKRRYQREIDINAAPTFRDVEVEAESVLNLCEWGEAYQLMNGWLKSHSDTEFTHRIDAMNDSILKSLLEDWESRKSHVQKLEANKRYLPANEYYKRYFKLGEGFDLPEAQKMFKFWKQSEKKNNDKQNALIRVKKRTEPGK